MHLHKAVGEHCDEFLLLLRLERKDALLAALQECLQHLQNAEEVQRFYGAPDVALALVVTLQVGIEDVFEVLKEAKNLL